MSGINIHVKSKLYIIFIIYIVVYISLYYDFLKTLEQIDSIYCFVQSSLCFTNTLFNVIKL